MAETEKILRCPRCGTMTPVNVGHCKGCGLKIVTVKKAPPPESKPQAAAEPANGGSAPSAVSVKHSASGMHMPKLRIQGLERHDDESLKLGRDSPAVERMTGLDRHHGEDDGAASANGGLRSLLMEPNEADGHQVKKESAPKMESKEANEPEMAPFLLSPSDTYGEAAGAAQPPLSGDSLSAKFGFKPHYQDTIKDSLPSSAGPIGAAPGNGIDALINEAGLSENPITSGYDLPFEPLPSNREDPFKQGKPRQSARRIGALSDEELLFLSRKAEGKRRLFTRFLPLALFCAALWYAGTTYGIPFVVVEGEWSGTIEDLDQLKAPFTVRFQRTGRHLAGEVHFNLPKAPAGFIVTEKVPKAVREIFSSPDGTAVGEFDVNKLRMRIYSQNPENYIEIIGDIRRDKNHRMWVKGDAVNSLDAEAQFTLYRDTLR